MANQLHYTSVSGLIKICWNVHSRVEELSGKGLGKPINLVVIIYLRTCLQVKFRGGMSTVNRKLHWKRVLESEH